MNCIGMDSAQWSTLAGLAQRVPLSVHLLAAAVRPGSAGRLAAHVANISGGAKRAVALEVERVVFGREFCAGPKRGAAVGKSKRGKVTKWMVVVDDGGVSLRARLYSASPAEIRLAEETCATTRGRRPWQNPPRVIAGKGYDSNAVRERLRRRGITLFAPHRSSQYWTPPQDGRVLRHYHRRWIVELSIAWLGNFPQLVVHHGRLITIHQALVHATCPLIVWQRVME